MQTFSIAVLPVNDNVPVIEGGATASFSIPENGTAVAMIAVTDADLPGDTLTYSIAGGDDEAKFTINATPVRWRFWPRRISKRQRMLERTILI